MGRILMRTNHNNTTDSTSWELGLMAWALATMVELNSFPGVYAFVSCILFTASCRPELKQHLPQDIFEGLLETASFEVFRTLKAEPVQLTIRSTRQ